MSWDPNTAVVLYQPIDFYAIASKEVSKSRTLISKTEDIKKYITPFTSTSQDRLAIRNNIKIITTNIPHESIEDLLTQAKVIMVAERHLMQSDRLNIARMINSFNPSDIQLLLEGNELHNEMLVFPEIEHRHLLTQAKSWDSQIAVNECIRFDLENFFPALYEGMYLLNLWSQIINKKPVDPYAANFLAKFDPSPEMTQDRFIITLDSFRKAAAAWTKEYKKIIEKREEMIDQSFFKRNIHLIEMVKQEAESNPNKIILIAGSLHLIKSNKYQESVEYIHTKMRESSLPFAILNSQISLQEEETNVDKSALHQKMRDIFSNSKKVFPIKEIDPLLQELQPKYARGQPILTPDLEMDLARLSAPILSLEYMSNDAV